ncbi:MAG TPA: flagellar basal body rod C-terminal domain-containing protein, partial [Candidatus Krumholzibacteria bacterium]|nr:flagellar basal body rod C-terminal domain-containing protein [Candidatus Krumholzibacteria bacterium]
TVRANGDEVGRLRIVRPENALAFTPDGATAFAVTEGAEPPRPVAEGTARVQAGFLEGSNTNAVSELVSMITAQRIFEAGQRVLTTADNTLRKATNDIPKMG